MMKFSEFSMVKKGLLVIALLCAILPGIYGQTPYRNKAFKETIRTVQVYPLGDPMGKPIIGLNSGEVLEFHFDELEGDLETYYYGAIHCSRDWFKSDIETTEYLQGFPSQRIDNIENSFNTMYEFVHYKFIFPNDMSKPRYSGNYLMVVSTNQDLSVEEDWILTYRFVVYETLVNVVPTVKPCSVIADRFKKQQVDFTVYHKDFRIFDPMRDVSATIVQNLDWNMAIAHLKPVFIKMDELTFDYSSGENAFMAGSEWRHFEMKNVRFASSEVETILYESDGYNVYLRPDLPQGNRAYSTKTDINGNFFIHNDQGYEADLEAEYVWVHFFMEMPETVEGEVRIEGRFTDFMTQPIVCKYDATKKGYTAAVLLKQGYYNYRFVIYDNYRKESNMAYTEGSDIQTENEYEVLVYMTDRNLDCDRIIGYRAINSVNRR
jgi:hypothetical protein